MLAVIGIILLSVTVAVFAVRLYRSTFGWGDVNARTVVLSPNRRPARPQRQRGFVRTLDGVNRDKSVRRSNNPSRRGKSGAGDKIRKPWGW